MQKNLFLSILFLEPIFLSKLKNIARYFENILIIKNMQFNLQKKT